MFNERQSGMGTAPAWTLFQPRHQGLNRGERGELPQRSRRPSLGRALVLAWSSAVIWGWVNPLAAAQPPGVSSPPPLPEATAAARSRQAQDQDDRSAPDRYDLSQHPLTAAQERHWRETLWATALREPQDPAVLAALGAFLNLTPRRDLDPAQQRMVEMALQISHQLYGSDPQGYGPLAVGLRTTVDRSPDAIWVALALSALVRAGLDADDRQSLLTQVKTRFPQWVQILPLNVALRDLTVVDLPTQSPPLEDLLQWQSVTGEPQLYVLCRPDRGVLCRTLLKDRDGQFYRETQKLGETPGHQAADPLSSVLLSGRSLHDLPWYLSRGETPQGLYRMEGTVPQPDTLYFRAFGFFDLVNLYVPFEPDVEAFVPPQAGTLQGGLGAYQALLPPRWRGYWPIQQTYWAGKLGRSLFRIHGTGEATDFFRNNQRFPTSAGWNPAIGCLSAQELYDDAGQLLQGDMPHVLAALTQVGGKDFTGYVTVVNVGEDQIPGENQPISISQLENLIATYQSVSVK